jgi:hypothetical protein
MFWIQYVGRFVKVFVVIQAFVYLGTTLTDEKREVIWHVNLNKYVLMRLQCLTVSQVCILRKMIIQMKAIRSLARSLDWGHATPLGTGTYWLVPRYLQRPFNWL